MVWMILSPFMCRWDENDNFSTYGGDDATIYMKIVGSLIYMTITRSDMNYAIWLDM